MADEQRQLIDAVASGGKLVPLDGTEAAPDAGGRLVQSPEGQKAFLLVQSIPRLPAGLEFHAWRITGGVPSRAGHFSLAANGRDQLVALFTNFFDVVGVGVSRHSSYHPKGRHSPLGPIPEGVVPSGRGRTTVGGEALMLRLTAEITNYPGVPTSGPECSNIE